MISRLNCYTALHEIWHLDSLFFEEECKLLFIAITDIHKGGAAIKTSYLTFFYDCVIFLFFKGDVRSKRKNGTHMGLLCRLSVCLSFFVTLFLRNSWSYRTKFISNTHEYLIRILLSLEAVRKSSF